MRVGGCLVVVAQWQSTGGSSQRCPGFDSRQLPAFFGFLYFRLITSKFIYFQREARCFEHFRENFIVNAVVMHIMNCDPVCILFVLVYINRETGHHCTLQARKDMTRLLPNY